MKPKLLIISDLLGFPAEEYIRILDKYFKVKYIDVRELAGIDKSLAKEETHTAFLKGGINEAAQNPVFVEVGANHILAFSIGGSIAWKNALKNENIRNLWLVSSTRLRVETEKPKSKIKLFFGGKDEFKPKMKWFKQMGLSQHFYPNYGHDLYEDIPFSQSLCKQIIRDVSTEK